MDDIQDGQSDLSAKEEAELLSLLWALIDMLRSLEVLENAFDHYEHRDGGDSTRPRAHSPPVPDLGKDGGMDAIAILDIGKTNTKVTLVADGRVIEQRRRHSIRRRPICTSPMTGSGTGHWSSSPTWRAGSTSPTSCRWRTAPASR